MFIIIGDLIAFVISVLVTLIIASVPVWVAAKIVAKRSTFGQAVAATLLSLIIFFILLFVFSIFTPFIGGIFGFIGALWVFRKVYNIGWVDSLALTIIAIFIAIMIYIILGAFLFPVIHTSMIHEHAVVTSIIV
ncbi:TVG0245034 [Thermoplasma volcanium GSS1]|uniref:TVG0245034 protein n=1 Tax=Thermoplasma volcanium (strain ATCC 51530 / DSM 4299 / JCM 9571 / NBRC 15438 / GSS1) TaxID=273116 RepID=Q97C69_THEVO|nr:hypothetical protein [Thermoplasma volcanium]BAB59377.1 TVG0245034 [Thermoplasma volcanium GSS1]